MVALQCLFAVDVREWKEPAPLDLVVEEYPMPAPAKEISLGLVNGVREVRDRLDALIHCYAPAWPVNQLPVVDRNVLRIALFELLYTQDTPKKLAANEAVEVAKVFGSESSTRFVNGVLGSIIADLESGTLVVEGGWGDYPPSKDEPVCGGR
jgi:N utilization substance protein B